MSRAGSRSSGDRRHHSSGMSRLKSWSNRCLGPIQPAAVEKPAYPVRIIATSALLRSAVAHSALKGPLVSAPSEPAPVVLGDLPVTEQM